MTSILTIKALDEPLLLPNDGTADYEVAVSRIKNAFVEIDAICTEKSIIRQDEAYIQIVNSITQKLIAAGSSPLSNASIDLATNYVYEPYLFEIRLINEENAMQSIRDGINNLYEQKYVQNVPLANMVLVTQRALPISLQWLVDFLESDRHLFLIWLESGEITASRRTKQKLSVLW